ncbi:MAG: hypothetical protein ABGX16_25220 [Pirellulales bacterium]
MIASTGPINTWQSNPQDIGPLYPFHGSEMLMFGISVTFFVTFLVWKFISENNKYKKQAKKIRQGVN